jgi:hypothetical protein
MESYLASMMPTRMLGDDPAALRAIRAARSTRAMIWRASTRNAIPARVRGAPSPPTTRACRSSRGKTRSTTSVGRF